MSDIPAHINGLGRIVIIRKRSLEYRCAIRQIRRAQYDILLTQMCLIPGKRIIIKRITSEEILTGIAVKQMIHEQHIIQIAFVKDGKIMNLLLIREQIADRMEFLGSFADFHDHEKL